MYQNGGSDPFYPDGVNLNLIRNHIIYYKRQLENELADGNFPEVYYKDTPPEVDMNYVARADEIRKNAAATLKVYQADERYIWCAAHFSELTDKEIKHSGIANILGYVSGLEEAIASDDLVTMRRHEYPDRYIDSFDRCVQEYNNIFSARTNEPQLSLFSAGAPQAGLIFLDEDTDSDEEFEDEAQTISM